MSQLESLKPNLLYAGFSSSTSVGVASHALAKARKAIDEPRNAVIQSRVIPMLDEISNTPSHKALPEKLYDALASFKIRTAGVARYLDSAWRAKFFAGLDRLLDVEAWEIGDSPPTDDSFSTLLRALILLRPERPPGLGASHDGKLLAAWTVGRDRLTLECLKNDRVLWIVSCSADGEPERAAGEVHISRLSDVLAPYNPNQRWFQHAPQEARRQS